MNGPIYDTITRFSRITLQEFLEYSLGHQIYRNPAANSKSRINKKEKRRIKAMSLQFFANTK